MRQNRRVEFLLNPKRKDNDICTYIYIFKKWNTFNKDFHEFI